MKANNSGISERIKLAAQNINATHGEETQQVEKANKLFKLLAFCIILLSAASVWIILKKKPNASRQNIETLNQNKTKNFAESTAENNEKIKEISKKLDTWANRIWLLGIAHNENINLTKKIQQKQGIQDPGFIVFDHEWKLNRMPSTMEMSEDQKDKLINVNAIK
jgi:hypothetical protein